ncbi:sigma-E processing peptidase SpoIIGA [Virgibacillus dokdonensis]|uniref:Sporulation sigma-E factor-processing peptidase n=1 Tax=Virgibacillus dokdonensis TaxID=302167 RepID=A0A2K9J4B0_9BACI|nr:sigma-E processing peptidase SpoIIGA [Virgibacillus dokdonensis]AUJ26767.1 Sporulation factor SpoIIGA [Virgibacillus dokdonensis]
MTIYLDAVWALNFLLDFMLLMLTQALARDDTKKLRLAIGAFVASLTVPISIYFPESIATSVPGKIVASGIIIIVAFGYRNKYRWVKLFALFYFVSFSIGGGLTAIHFLLQRPFYVHTNGFLTYNSGFGDPISWLFIVIGFPIVWLFTKCRLDKHVQEKIRYDQILPVTIEMKGKSYSTTGFIDSGNQLTDPITKKPVVLCDEVFLKQWFSEQTWTDLERCYHTFQIEALPAEWEKYLQIVPYQGVEGNNMFLFTLRPERIIIYYGEERITTRKALIGIQFGELTKDASYHCLLHPRMIQTSTIHSA